MGAELKGRLASEVEPHRVVRLTNKYFFEEQGFNGNRDDYYDPRNSYLNEVMDRRVGIPITLSVLYIAVSERAGLPVKGVGMPGHFLVKYEPAASSEEIFIDPYHRRILDREGCTALLQELFGQETEIKPSFFKASSRRQILARMLNNLKALYLSRGDLQRALTASDRIMMADPHLTSEWRDRGTIEFQLHHDTAALSDFTRYLEIRPEPEDAPRVRQLRAQLLARLN
jgi:regulator of sirC expression with transglutaminase-like and TPR domain